MVYPQVSSPFGRSTGYNRGIKPDQPGRGLGETGELKRQRIWVSFSSRVTLAGSQQRMRGNDPYTPSPMVCF